MIYDISGNEIIHDRLHNKSILAIGDSFVKGHTLSDTDTWLYKLAGRHNMISVNCGINGTSLAYSNPESYPSIMENYQSYISNNPNMDYIVVIAGHNDASANLHGGTAIPIGTNTDSVNTTFKGALNILISALITAYPTGHILFLSPFNRHGTEADYAEAMKDITGIYSIPFYDCYRRSEVCFQNNAQNSAFGIDDSLHLNAAGNERLSHIIEAKLFEL